MLNSIFINNTADDGGAIYYYDGSFNCSVVNSAFLNNTADDGGAIYYYDGCSNCSVVNSTFSNNSDDGKYSVMITGDNGLNVTLPENDYNNLTVQINNKTYSTSSNNTVQFNIPDLENKTYAIILTFIKGDNNKYIIYDNVLINSSSNNKNTDKDYSNQAVVINADNNSIYVGDKTDSILKITNKDGVGVEGVNITVRLYKTSDNFIEQNYTTNNNGEITVSAPSDVGNYTLNIRLSDDKYDAEPINRTITVLASNNNTNNNNGNDEGENDGNTISSDEPKVYPSIIGKSRVTFKVKTKVNKYTITLKARGILIKKVIVYLKIGKKTIKAKTNNKGKATFKIKFLKKKGKYQAKVQFNYKNYYKKYYAAKKNVKIKVKM